MKVRNTEVVKHWPVHSTMLERLLVEEVEIAVLDGSTGSDLAHVSVPE